MVQIDVKTVYPPFIWMGGKAWAIPLMFPLWKWYQGNAKSPVYFDLTLGGGAIPLGLMPEKVMVNDASHHLINCWRWIQRGAPQTIEFLNTKSEYYALRSKYNAIAPEFEYEMTSGLFREGLATHEELGVREKVDWLGQAFWLLNASCWRGRWRVNRWGAMNIEWGQRPRLREIEFGAIANTIRAWEFRCLSAETIIPPEGSFVVFDPPYIGKEGGYTSKPFKMYEQDMCARVLAFHSGPVVAFNSEQATSLYEKYGFNVYHAVTRRGRIAPERGENKSTMDMVALKGFPQNVLSEFEEIIDSSSKG